MEDMEEGGPSTSSKGMSHVEQLLEDFGSMKRTQIHCAGFVTSRARELATLMDEVKGNYRGNRRLFQLLPKHMRRRTMSHDPKRVPRKLREAHVREMEKFKKVIPRKKPSRKHRRRPKNLLLEYNRRQRTHVWLETHIWHAKRFVMTEKWGYKLAVHPNDKGIRPAYRAASNVCLLQDMSFWCCVEVSGEEDRLLEGFRQITSPECGPTVAAKMCIDGDREGSVMLYHRQKYPFGALGAIRFLWEPRPLKKSSNSNENKRKIWLWVHPTCHQEIVNEITEVFEMQLAKTDDSCNSGPLQELKSGKQHAKLIPKLESFYTRAPLYTSADLQVTMLLLKDTLTRFRITGPAAGSVLGDALVLMPLEQSGEVSGEGKSWSQMLYEDAELIDAMKIQYDTWSAMKSQSAANVPPNCVLGLVVRDPRYFLPKAKTSPTVDTDVLATSTPTILSLPHGANWSTIWQQSIRDEVTFSKMPDCEVNKLRAEMLVPGSDMSALQSDSRIPILLVQRPGQRSSCQGFGSGWDVVAPCGWAMAFWIALVYRGARVGGLREDDALNREVGLPRHPADFPDTAAAIEASKDTKKQLIEKYFKYPPNKRPNYIKLGAVAPFCCPWDELTTHWLSRAEREDAAEMAELFESESEAKLWCGGFYVLRDRKKLKMLKELMGEKTSDTLPENLEGRCLVPVKLEMVSKGCPSPFSMICLVKPNDKQDAPVTERPGHDYPRLMRRAFRKKIKKDAGKRRSLAKARKRGTGSSNTSDDQVTSVDPAVLEKLYFPDVVRRLLTNSRQIIGFVTGGEFSFSCGFGSGFGFVVQPAFKRLLKSGQRQHLCLVRATNSNAYKFARLSIAETV